MITFSRLKETLDYDPISGKFTRLKIGTPGNQRYVGECAGSRDAKGYLCICIDGQTYKAHRLAWIYMTGEWPKNQIDHANGDKSDNRFSNLRQATFSQNQQNKGMQAKNTSGYKGVHWFPRRKPWRATINCNGERIYLGSYVTKEEAAKAYATAAQSYHVEFAKAHDL